MGHGPEENWTEIDRLAYKLYVKWIKGQPNIYDYASDTWFCDNKEEFKDFYDKVELVMRNRKIKKIINES